jgi:glycosyltransferase involved in cell wall biosynthesis
LYRRIAGARVQVSIPATDTTSAALLDGLAAGLVPVVSDLPGPREWVDDSIGEIVPRDPSVADVAGAIVRAVMRDIPRERLRDRVRDVTWEREIDRLVDAYRSLLLRRG